MLPLSWSPLSTMFSTGHYNYMSAHCLPQLWPLIAPFQPGNSTGAVLWLEENEIAKQVWAGQGYMKGIMVDRPLYIWVNMYSTSLM